MPGLGGLQGGHLHSPHPALALFSFQPPKVGQVFLMSYCGCTAELQLVLQGSPLVHALG